MKTITTKPKIKIPTIPLPKKPLVGMRMPRVAGMLNPFRINK